MPCRERYVFVWMFVSMAACMSMWMFVSMSECMCVCCCSLFDMEGKHYCYVSDIMCFIALVTGSLCCSGTSSQATRSTQPCIPPREYLCLNFHVRSFRSFCSQNISLVQNIHKIGC